MRAVAGRSVILAAIAAFALRGRRKRGSGRKSPRSFAAQCCYGLNFGPYPFALSVSQKKVTSIGFAYQPTGSRACRGLGSEQTSLNHLARLCGKSRSRTTSFSARKLEVDHDPGNLPHDPGVKFTGRKVKGSFTEKSCHRLQLRTAAVRGKEVAFPARRHETLTPLSVLPGAPTSAVVPSEDSDSARRRCLGSGHRSQVIGPS